jgi:DNA primase
MKTLPAMKYLIEERGLTESTIREFHLGYVDPKGTTYIDAGFEGMLPQMDFRFYNSSLFPVQSLYGDVVGISCRPLVAKPDMPKYINSSYEKSEHLYGLNVTWKDAVKEKSIYIVEGNVDVLQMRQKGIRHVASLLGSNFSVTQLGILLGLVEKTTFVLDGDMAGLNFMEKLKSVLLKRYKDVPMSFYFKFLPFDGKTKVDPDSFLLQHSKEEFLALPEVKVQ